VKNEEISKEKTGKRKKKRKVDGFSEEFLGGNSLMMG